MDNNRFQQLDLKRIPSPCFIIDEAALEENLKLLQWIQDEGECKILLALKAFAMFSVFPLMRSYLSGVCASSQYEARLGKEEFGKLVHSYGPAYSREELTKLIGYSDYIIFNSARQWQTFKPLIPSNIRCGLRINPGYSEIEVDLYNPCAANSRLGIPKRHFPGDLEGISGLHFHAMCEQNADTLWRIWEVVESQFGSILPAMEWINLGGGHHITRPDYDCHLLIKLVKEIKNKYGLEVFLEPGEAIALNTGVLTATVLDVIENGMQIAILDTSAEAHMPDVLAMPYKPEIIGAGDPGEYAFPFRLAGVTCLAGDVIGDYSFPTALKPGDRVIFTDMAHYTMVKINMFNGVNLPSIAKLTNSGEFEMIRQFTYQTYKDRLS